MGPILFCGDPHGGVDGSFQYIVRAAVHTKASAVILLGDMEPARPLHEELASIIDCTWWINGNHDSDSDALWERVWGSKLADRCLDGKVTVLPDGTRIAGLGGVFREAVWHPTAASARGGAPACWRRFKIMRSKKRAVCALMLTCAGIALCACGGGSDGGGSGGGGSGGGGNGGGAAVGHVLFATDYTHGVVAAFDTLEPSAGQDLAGHVVITTPGGGGSIAYDASRDKLYVLVSWLGESPSMRVDVYDHASALRNGAVATRSITLTKFYVANAIALDPGHDRLWVGGFHDAYSQGELRVYEHASTLAGSPAPDREIEKIAPIQNMALDAVHSVLYTIGGSPAGVQVYANAATVVTGEQPTGFIGGGGAYGIAVDGPRDILYLPDVFTGVAIVEHASTAPATAPAVLQIAGASTLTAAVDSAHDRLYIGAYTQAFAVDNASTLTATSQVTAAGVTGTGVSIFSFAFP